MASYTAFCQSNTGEGTIWIEHIDAPSVNAAIGIAIDQCAAAWECDADEVHCLGIAAGNIDILHWQDLNDD